jgi:hypothetical protein
MDLFCPHCTRRVTVADDKAGQVTNCPLCAKQFVAPSLAPPPSVPKPPPPPVSAPRPPAPSYEPSAPAAPTPSPKPSSPMVSQEPAPSPAPPPPPGDYTRSFSCTLSESWIAFVPPACVVLVFILSFFTWHGAYTEDGRTVAAYSLWGLAFDQWQGFFVAYTLLMFPTGLLTIGALPFDKGWITLPPAVGLVLVFKNLLIGLLLGLTFLFLAYDYFDSNLFQKTNPIAVPLKLAIRLHLAALAASFWLFFLNWRKRSNLPAPKIEMRW